jgi:hypothetical protein
MTERKQNPPIPGHALLNEGHIFPRYRNGEIVDHTGGCQCGAQPEDRWPELSARQMKAWHRGHKEEIRAEQEGEPL